MSAGAEPTKARDAHVGAFERLGSRTGVRSIVLVDRSGRVVRERGVGDRRTLTRIAVLMAGLHAISARIAEAAGDPGRSIVRIGAGSGEIILAPLPLPSTHVLMIALERRVPGIDAGLPGALAELARAYPGGREITDASAFEASLLRNLRGTDGA